MYFFGPKKYTCVFYFSHLFKINVQSKRNLWLKKWKKDGKNPQNWYSVAKKYARTFNFTIILPTKGKPEATINSLDWQKKHLSLTALPLIIIFPRFINPIWNREPIQFFIDTLFFYTSSMKLDFLWLFQNFCRNVVRDYWICCCGNQIVKTYYHWKISTKTSFV